MSATQTALTHISRVTISRVTAATVAVAAAAIALAGCSLTIDAGPMGGTGSGNPSRSEPPWKDAEPNRFDVAFSMMMIPHHQQAIDMADMILTKEGMRPGVVDLAGRIKAGQVPEIALMESWLDDWGFGMPGMGSIPGMEGMGHGGMVSEADMDALREASGTEAGRLFLEHMIEHHDGAIDMAEREIEQGRYRPTIDLARTILVTQQAEITEMEELLTEF